MTQPAETGAGQSAGIEAQGGLDGTGQGGVGQEPGASGAVAPVQPAEPQGKTYTQAELDAITARMQAADRRASALEAERNQLRDKDLPAQEKLQRDHDAAVERAEVAEKALTTERMHNAFLTNAKFKWHSPEAALKLLDTDKISIGDDGKVIGMENAIEALAKSHPFLVVTEVEPKEEPLPGTAPGNGGSGSGQPTTKKMESRFPALRGRG